MRLRKPVLSGFPASRNPPSLLKLFRLQGLPEPGPEFCAFCRVPAQKYVPPFTPVISLSFYMHLGFGRQIRCGHLLGSPG